MASRKLRLSEGHLRRDKDAVVASMLVCEMAAALKCSGKTILDALKDIYSTYGYYLAMCRALSLRALTPWRRLQK